MNRLELLNFYKELYFHELNTREKVIGRAQLVFAFQATVLTVISYIIKSLDWEVSSSLSNLTYTLSIISLIPLITSVYYTIRAFWGNAYKEIITPVSLEEYRKSCEAHEAEIKYYNSNVIDEEKDDYNAEANIFEYLYQTCAECASHNININDLRSGFMHRGFQYLLYTAIPLVAACLLFVFGDLDASSPRKGLVIKQADPIVIENVSHIKEDRESLIDKLTMQKEKEDENTQSETMKSSISRKEKLEDLSETKIHIKEGERN